MEPSVSTTPVWDADLETMRKYLRTALNLNLSRNVALFRAWDRDRNAVVNRNDFRRALLTLSYPGGTADIDALYSSISKAADKDKEIYSVLQRAADSSIPVPRYHHEIGGSEIDHSGHRSVPNSDLEAHSRRTGQRAGPAPPGSEQDTGHSPRRYGKPEEVPPLLPTPTPLKFGHTPLPTWPPGTSTTKPAAWYPAKRVSPSAQKPHFTEDASFLGWTLDDLPSITRTIFNGARALEGIQLPASMESVLIDSGAAPGCQISPSKFGSRPGPPGSPPAGGSPSKFGIRRWAFEGGGPSRASVPDHLPDRDDLWALGDLGLHSFTPLIHGSKGASAGAIDDMWHQHSELRSRSEMRSRSEIQPGSDERKTSPAKTSPAKTSPAKTSPAKTSPAKTSPAKTSPAKTSPAMPGQEMPPSSDGRTFLPPCLERPATQHRHQLRALFAGWDRQRVGAMPVDVLISSLCQLCPFLEVGEAERTEIIQCSPPALAVEAMIDTRRLWRLMSNHVAAERSQYLRTAVREELPSRAVNISPIEVTTR